MIRYLIGALLLALFPLTALAEPIQADRPGLGSDPELVSPGQFQLELGTDSMEARLGLLRGLELDRDDTHWSLKAAVLDHDPIKASVKLSYDGEVPSLEIPASYRVTPWLTLGLDALWDRSGDSYAAEFALSPTQHLTLTPTLYHDGKLRGAVFAAWIPPGHENLQFDVGLDKGKVSAGVSVALGK